MDAVQAGQLAATVKFASEEPEQYSSGLEAQVYER